MKRKIITEIHGTFDKIQEIEELLRKSWEISESHIENDRKSMNFVGNHGQIYEIQ